MYYNINRFVDFDMIYRLLGGEIDDIMILYMRMRCVLGLSFVAFLGAKR